MASFVPLLSLKKLVDGTIDLNTDTFKVTLHTSTFAPNRDTIDFYDDVTNELATANGYTAGGATLAGLAFSDDSANDRTEWTFTAVVWTATGTLGPCRYAVIRKSRGGAASADEIVLVIDFVSDKQAQDANFTLTPNAEGALQLVAA